MTRIVVTGRTGQVGSAFFERLGRRSDVIFVDRDMVNIANPEAVHGFLRQIEPEVIINTAAYTAVDYAETDATVARCVNRDGVEAMAEWVESVGGLLIHYSTDYVFDGQKTSAYVEDDPTAPLSVYGRTKWEGEEVIRQSGCRHLILRTTWVIGKHGKNFIRAILRLAAERETLNVVADQWGVPSSADFIAETTLQLLRKLETEDHELGTYHLVPHGVTNWYELAKYTLELAWELGLLLKLRPEALHAIPTEAYPLPAKRPKNSRLSCDKISREFDLNLPHWQEGAADVVRSIIAEMRKS